MYIVYNIRLAVQTNIYNRVCMYAWTHMANASVRMILQADTSFMILCSYLMPFFKKVYIISNKVTEMSAPPLCGLHSGWTFVSILVYFCIRFW